MSAAEEIVDIMLETQHDAHVKVYDRLKHWDGAVESFKKLMALKKQAMEKMTQLGTALGYERALAYAGLEKADVSHPIRGANAYGYSGTEQIKGCKNPNCDQRFERFNRRSHRPMEQENCAECGGPLTVLSVPISKQRLEMVYGRHIVGVETKDGRKVWFKEPVQ